MLADVGFLGQRCIDSGGVWCTADGLSEDSTGMLLMLALLLSGLALVVLVLLNVLRVVRASAASFRESRKGDL